MATAPQLRIGDAERDVVQTGTAFFEKFSDGGIGRGGLQQLDARFARGEHGDFDFLGGDGFAAGDGEA